MIVSGSPQTRLPRARIGQRACLAARLVAAGALATALALPGVSSPAAAFAATSWLDQPIVNWNRSGLDVPPAPAGQPSPDPACQNQGRPAETDADAAVSAAGWTLYSSYTGGWGVTVVKGLSGMDGMCRPLGYQEFVFVDGSFAGTLSPSPMDSRTDGSGDLAYLNNARQLTATFQRYQPTDPLCCPSKQQSIVYTIDRSGSAPVLVPSAG